MEGLGHFSPRPYPDLWAPPPPREERASFARLDRPGPQTEPDLCSWAGTPRERSEAPAPRLHPPCSPTPRAGRRRYPDSPRESRSLTDVAREPPDRARKHRPRSRRLQDAWGEAGTKLQAQGGGPHNPAWRQQPSCQHCPPAREDSPPPHPQGADALPRATSRVEEVPSGDQWAARVCRDLGRWSLSSVHTEKSSVPSGGLGTQSACAYIQKRHSNETVASLASQYSQPSLSSQGMRGQHPQILKNKLEEALMSSRDQKIVALVLSRLKKAQRMRELQQQAAVAWEELKRSDQKVQLTLERERQLLLLQNQEQWRQEKEHRVRRRDRQAKITMQQDSGWTAQLEDPENRRREKLERAPSETETERGKPCEARLLQEQARMLQDLREQNSRLQLQKRLAQAFQKRPGHAAEDQTKVGETNLTSLVNHQARKVLMDCQAKAEELLRKLSLEQSSQCSQETPRRALKDHRPEPKEDARFQQVQGCPGESGEQREEHERRQKMLQAGSKVPRNISDQARHVRELGTLRESARRILKLKAEKDETQSHVEGIKEAVRKRERRMEQISREKDATCEQFQRICGAARTDNARAHARGFFDRVAGVARDRAGQQRGGY
uniref:Coiled-coil domain containing 185 n=1 Tax=Catagonus wagneri TaxID=51154 RepID=A0A8C3YBL2_9CETA